MIDKILRNRYKITDDLSHGGFGITYLAVDLDLPNNPQCVVKQMVPQNQEFFQVAKGFFDEEAKTLQVLGEHNQIPRLFAYFEDGGQFYLVQEFIEGNNLSEEICQGKKWGEIETVRLLIEILEVLEYIHEKNVIHRDLKPQNIMRRKADGKIVLIDFGAVKQITGLTVSGGKTRFTRVVGTPGYMPKEQAAGFPQFCSDIYAVGVIGIEALTGVSARESIDPQSGHIIWKDKANINNKLSSILDKMLEDYYTHRYQKVDEVIAELKEVSNCLDPSLIFKPTVVSNSPANPVSYSSPPSVNSSKATQAKNGWKIGLGIAVGAILTAIIIAIFGPRIIIDKTEKNLSISSGGTSLFAEPLNSNKKFGIEDLREKRFESAIDRFRLSLNRNKNDPETVIFLNNAIAQQKLATGTGEIVEIAVSVPANERKGDPNIAKEILRGVALAQGEFNCGDDLKVEEINIENCQGSLNGKFLKVTITDDEYQPETAQQIAENLVKNEAIIAVIGHYSSDMTLEAGEIYDKHRLVAISPTSTSVALLNFSEFVFKVAPSDRDAAKALFDYFKEEIGEDKKVAVAYIPKNLYSKSLAEEFEERLPTKFVRRCYLDRGNFSAQQCVSEAKNQGAEVMLLVPATDQTLTNVIGIIDNAKGLNLLGGDSVYNPRVLKDEGERAASSKLTIAIAWHRHPDSEFANAARDFWGAEVNWRTATSYDAGKTIIKALEESNGNYSREQLQKALSSPNFVVEGVTGEIRFNEKGDRLFTGQNKSVLVQVEPISGKYQFVIWEE